MLKFRMFSQKKTTADEGSRRDSTKEIEADVNFDDV